MHSLADVLAETRKDSTLCVAIEKGKIVCFKERQRDKTGKISSKYCGKHASRLARYKSFDLPPKAKKNCKRIPCDGLVIALGYCEKHYRQHHSLVKQKCTVENCNSPLHVGLYCNKHYIRMKRYGDLNANFSNLRFRNIKKGSIPHNKGKFNIKICIAPGCEIKNGDPYRFTKGLCKKHFARWKKYGDYNIVSKKEYLEKKPDKYNNQT